MIAGVCGGLGEFFGISPNWFRLAFLLMMQIMNIILIKLMMN